jgi:tRNA-dihydrouridine synthase B
MKFVNFDIKNNIFLAPMAGITDLAFRTVCREHGAGLCYSEMISSRAMVFQDRKTRELLKTNKEDNPLVIQLFGCEPDIMGEASKLIEESGFKMIDINSGCPTPKIVNNGDGCALMKNPKLLGEIVKNVVNSVKIPVSVKIRTGYNSDSINAVECAKVAEANGASSITVHGRTREQFYSGKADYSIIRDVKNAVKIPVTGNGDIFSPEDALKLFSETGCDAVMVGRGSLGNPFIFNQINDLIEKGSYEDYPLDYKLSVLKRQVDLMVQYKNEHRAILEARKHLAWYLKGLKNSKVYRQMSNSVNTLEEVDNLCRLILSE